MQPEPSRSKLHVAKRQSKKFGRSSLQLGTLTGDEFEEWKKARQLLRPADQLNLSDLELKEEIARVLTYNNPQLPDNLVEFSHAQAQFITVPTGGNTVVLLNIKGTAIHRDSDEARKQIELMGEDDDEYQDLDEEPKGSKAGDDDEELEGEGEGEGGEGEGEGGGEDQADVEGADPDDPDAEPKPKDATHAAPGKSTRAPLKKKLTNQFNFSERAALTYNNPNRSQSTQTIPPPRGNFGALVLQWIIYDAYAEDYAIQQREKEKEKKVLIVQKKVITKKKRKPGENSELQEKLLIAWKTLERMVNLNTYNDIARDYRYWEDPSDDFRDGEGTLLPLWKFVYEKTKKATITSVIWNPWYYDMFAVTFGTLVFHNNPQGAICIFSIKNPSFPEHICLTPSCVMCIDIHPKYPFMVVVGLYDGSVCVFNVTINCQKPQYKSNSVENKHRGIVWQVKWRPDMQDGEMNFYSAAADGLINNWILMQNNLALTTIIVLYLDQDPVPGSDGTFIKMKASATSMVFHPENPLIFLVGTEEGLIYKCSTLYSSTYLFTYHAHYMPVYGMDYNKYNSNIFLSCSSDWRLKIWEDMRQEPLFVFDLKTTISCAEWSPYSSTVFAACTTRGEVFIFDLNVNKYKAICTQRVVSKRKHTLTRLSFNSKLPILIVGDDKGCVHTLKLSPNLRIPCKAPKKQQYLDQWTLQCMKLDRIMDLVREPPTLTAPEDVETIPDT